MKSLFNVSATLKVLGLVLVLSLTACDNPIFDPIDPGNGGGGKGGGKNPLPTATCTIEGKMVRVMCGASIYDGLWIETADGKLYQPCDQSFQTICPIDLAEGDKVKFGYHLTKGNSSCDSFVTCLAALPPHKSVVIDCITKVASSTPTLLIDSSVTHDSNITIIDAKVAGNILKLKIGYSGCSTKAADKFKLYWDGSSAKSNPTKVNLSLVDIAPEACMAYFTQDVEYDISLLKMYGSPIEITIKDAIVVYR